jgi:Tfp pilus assembly protein PilF
MARIIRTCRLCVEVVFVSICFIVSSSAVQTADANDFPGPGNRSDWSEALPYYNLGNKYLNQERYQDAVIKYEAAIAYYKFDPDFYVNLGIAYRKLDDYTNAEIAFKQATQLNPKDWVAWNDLANAYLKQNKLKETIATFQRTLICQPPAGQRAAIQRDIADIQKYLRMQAPGNQVSDANSNVRSQASVKKSQSARAPMARSQQQLLKDNHETVSPFQQRLEPTKQEKDELKKSGWDYIYK